MRERIPYDVSEIMTCEVVALDKDTTLEVAERTLRQGGFRHLPVVDRNQLVGVVSDRDLLRASESPFSAAHASDVALKQRRTIGEIMEKDVISVRPNTPLIVAGRILRSEQIGCLPVTQASGELVGIVTLTDFLGLALGFLFEADLERMEPVARFPSCAPMDCS